MKCLWCGEEVERAQPILSFLLGANRKCICVNCEHPFMELKQHPTCLECGRLMTKVEVCPDCQKWHQVKESVLLKNTALYAYDEAGRKFMELFKFVGDTRVMTLVIKELRQELLKYQKRGFVLCPLPSSSTSLRKREFETIPTLLEQCHVSTVSLLEHIGSGKKQSEKTRQERLQLKQPFKIREGLVIPRKVLLVDDVYTTGATLHLAAKALTEMGVEEVESLTLFR